MTTYRKPTAPQPLRDEPAAGNAVVFIIEVTLPTGESMTSYSAALLGPGRDYMTREDALTAHIQTEAVTTTLSKEYETISALVADFPEVHLCGTAKRMLAAERIRSDYQQEVANWKARLEAAGVEPCQKCGGAGGWSGWPGFTCYDCGGSGV